MRMSTHGYLGDKHILDVATWRQQIKHNGITWTWFFKKGILLGHLHPCIIVTTFFYLRPGQKKRTILVMHHVISKNLQSDFAAMHRCVKSRQSQVAFARCSAAEWSTLMPQYHKILTLCISSMVLFFVQGSMYASYYTLRSIHALCVTRLCILATISSKDLHSALKVKWKQSIIFLTLLLGKNNALLVKKKMWKNIRIHRFSSSPCSMVRKHSSSADTPFRTRTEVKIWSGQKKIIKVKTTCVLSLHM